jgi:hypothetical protein
MIITNTIPSDLGKAHRYPVYREPLQSTLANPCGCGADMVLESRLDDKDQKLNATPLRATCSVGCDGRGERWVRKNLSENEKEPSKL